MSARPPSPAKRQGLTFTPPALAETLARVSLAFVQPAEGLSVLDPAVGDGALLLAAARALAARGIRRPHLRGFDPDGEALARAERRLREAAPEARVTLGRADFLDAFLREAHGGPADWVLTNPPWVRTQVLGAARARALAARFGLKGKVDLAWAFLAALPALLAPGGVAGVLAPASLLRSSTAAPLRARLGGSLALREVWDLGDTRLFDAAVVPAMLVAQAGPEAPEVPMREAWQDEAPATARAPDALAALDLDGLVALPDGRRLRVRHGRLARDTPEAPWRLSTPEDEAWLRAVEAATDRRFSDLGAAHVGIKSTADAVFIRAEWGAPPPELLRPLHTHESARAYRARPVARHVLYPHERRDGRCRPVDLDDHPLSRAWLEAHHDRLASRAYLTRAGRRWYELWVPHDPEAWAGPKLVWRDISPAPCFWLDDSGALVNGDCYWLKPHPDLPEPWLWLALGVANSALAARFYDLRFNQRLYAGRRRYMCQYIYSFPLPDGSHPASIRIIEGARRAWAEQGGDAALRRAISDEVDRAFGVETR